MDKVFTIKEFAEELKVSVMTVRRMIQNNKIKAFKVGSLWRINSSELDNIRQDKE
jgi:excisionase family DNA binding protein